MKQTPGMIFLNVTQKFDSRSSILQPFQMPQKCVRGRTEPDRYYRAKPEKENTPFAIGSLSFESCRSIIIQPD
jgi:hypothetical protein